MADIERGPEGEGNTPAERGNANGEVKLERDVADVCGGERADPSFCVKGFGEEFVLEWAVRKPAETIE